MSDVRLEQRYELAAALSDGLRVLDLGSVPPPARRALEERAAELTVGSDAGQVDVVVALDGLADAERRQRIVQELERHAGEGARVLAAFDCPVGRPSSPRAEESPERAAAALADRLAGATVLRQFLAEGSLIAAAGADGMTRELNLRGADLLAEDAAALIVASGFEDRALEVARLSLQVAAAPVLLSYVRGLEAAHAELVRANRQLMRERVGRDGSAAAALLNAQRQLEEMRTIARNHEEHVRRIEAWYDAPRYHLVDRVRGGAIRVPGFAGFIRFLWSLISTRAETPKLDAAANRQPGDEESEASEVTREREGLVGEPGVGDEADATGTHLER